MAALSNQSWRDRAIERSEIITDGWEVTKTYAGRLAEWVLFLCMIFCIVEILPGVTMPVWMSNTVLGVQAVMLDIGGFALSSMADQARTNGDEQAAHKADITGRFLIGIVILTLTLITVGLLYTPAKPFTDDAEKVLILVRVMMTVVYGHVIHSLRRTTAAALSPIQVANFETRMREQVERMTEVFQTPPTLDYQEIARQLLPLVAQVIPDTTGMVEQLQQMRTNLEELAAKSALQSSTKNAPEIAPDNTLSGEAMGDEGAPECAPTNVTSALIEERHNITLMSDRRSAQTRTKTNTANRSEKARKAASIIKRNPQISAPELAKKAQISTSYARKLIINQ